MGSEINTPNDGFEAVQTRNVGLDRPGDLSKAGGARQNDSSSERFAAVSLGTIVLLIHRLSREKKIASGCLETGSL